jgi:hypothetical protein
MGAAVAERHDHDERLDGPSREQVVENVVRPPVAVPRMMIVRRATSRRIVSSTFCVRSVAATIAINTLSSPVGPLLSMLLIGAGGLAGQRLLARRLN